MVNGTEPDNSCLKHIFKMHVGTSRPVAPPLRADPSSHPKCDSVALGPEAHVQEGLQFLSPVSDSNTVAKYAVSAGCRTQSPWSFWGSVPAISDPRL